MERDQRELRATHSTAQHLGDEKLKFIRKRLREEAETFLRSRVLTVER